MIIEKRCTGLTVKERKDMRQQYALSILQKLGDWMKQEYGRVRPKAIWRDAGLQHRQMEHANGVYQQGQTGVLNNLLENSVRSVTLGRKNPLVAKYQKLGTKLR